MHTDLPVTFADVCAAAERLRGVANRTPIMTSRTFDEMTGRQVFFKCENFQRGGAFKFRGAYNRLSQLNDDEKNHGVVAFSSATTHKVSRSPRNCWAFLPPSSCLTMRPRSSSLRRAVMARR